MQNLSELFRTNADCVPKVSAEEISKYERYLALLEEWNARFNLVSKNSLLNAFSSHFVDSIWIADVAKTHGTGRFIDLGSGAGFPGMVFAIRHNTKVFLYERTGKKRNFLEVVKKELLLPVDILTDFQRDADVCTIMARAVLPPAKLFKALENNIRRGSRLVLPLAKDRPESLVAGKFKLMKSIPYSLPIDGANRSVAVFELPR